MQKRIRAAEASNTGRSTRRGAAVTLPEVINMDVLGTMQDEDLVLRLRALNEDHARAYESGRDTYPWEVEIAYVRREQQIRRIRRDNHAEITRLAEIEFRRLEESLPVADIEQNNAPFVYAATGGRPPRWSNN